MQIVLKVPFFWLDKIDALGKPRPSTLYVHSLKKVSLCPQVAQTITIAVSPQIHTMGIGWFDDIKWLTLKDANSCQPAL